MYATEWVWSEDLNNIFTTLDSAFDIEVNVACSMHIHMRPVGGWHGTDIRSLFKALGVFDDAITRIMPASRKQNPWARSNFNVIPPFVSAVPKKLYSPPELTGAEEELVTFFSKMKSSKKSWAHLFRYIDDKVETTEDTEHLADTRGVSMNFKSVNADCETVEFRRPPGVAEAKEARKWVAFALGFVSAALDPTLPNWDTQWSSNKNDATVADLQKFVGSGLGRLASLTSKSSWKSVVKSSAFEEDPSKPYSMKMYSPAVLQAKLMKASLFEKAVCLHFLFLPNHLRIQHCFCSYISCIYSLVSSNHANSSPSQASLSRSNSRSTSRTNSPSNVPASNPSSSRGNSPSRPQTPTKSGLGSKTGTPAGTPGTPPVAKASATKGPGNGPSATPGGSPVGKKKVPAGTATAGTGTGTGKPPSGNTSSKKLPVGSHKKPQ
jgi:hypothetical protein